MKPTGHVPLLWVGFVLASLLALDLLDLTVWSIAVSLAAGALWLVSSGWWRSPSIRPPGTLDRRDLAVIAALYLAVVGLWRLAFTVFPPTAGWGCSCASAAACCSGWRSR